MFPITCVALMGALVNSMVHTVMYTYYGLTAFGPTIQKYIGKYKRRVTQLQLVRLEISSHAYNYRKWYIYQKYFKVEFNQISDY